MQRRHFLRTACAAGLVPALPATAQARSTAWTDSLGHGFGIALHDFSDATLDVAATAGFTLIRTDFFWSAVETKRHIYDWSVYDGLMIGLNQRALRPVFVLGFNNPDVYGGRWMEGITMSFEIRAFAAGAAAAATRYRDADPIWEVYNEPNRTNFWEPAANPAEYMTLARATISDLRAVQPQAIIIAPALGHKMAEPVLDLRFLQACAQDGLLPLIDAVSVHPYVDPEVVAPDYAAVRAALAPFQRDQRPLPILSTEWGFATNTFVSDDLQADVLVRMFLINRSLGVPLSIAYVAVDRTEAYVPPDERSYGIVNSDHSPKAAFYALQTMMARLQGMSFVERVALDNPADVALVFASATACLTIVWTAAEPHDGLVNGATVALTSRPQYFQHPD